MKIHENISKIAAAAAAHLSFANTEKLSLKK
jgi:hypothetical protein